MKKNQIMYFALSILMFQILDFSKNKKQLIKDQKKSKQLKYNKDKVVNRVIKNLKKQLGRKLTSEEIYSIKNYK